MPAVPEGPLIPKKAASEWAIWGFALGYFACYVPYSGLTKALTRGLLPGVGAVDGLSILPANAVANVLVSFLFISAMGWWRYSGRRAIGSLSLPFPGLWTALSGMCTAVVIGTTTLAYSFGGLSIVFMLLLMKGGVLVIAPAVDALGGRKVRWFSWAALALSLLALVCDFTGSGSLKLTVAAALDVTFYLAAYFIRFRFMTRLAKTEDPAVSRRYFVEEQVAAVVFFLGILALAALALRLLHPAGGEALVAGFGPAIWADRRLLTLGLLIGSLSQGTGIFGSLVFLDPRENTFCVPVNRVSSVFAGLLVTVLLTLLAGEPPVRSNELLGAGFLVLAIVALSLGPAWEKRRVASPSGSSSPGPGR